MAFDFSSLAGFTLFGNSGIDYAVAFGIVVGGVVLLRVFRDVVLHHLKAVASRTSTDLDDFLVKTLNRIHWPLYLVVSVYVALQALSLPSVVERLFHYALVIGGTYYVVRTALGFVDYFSEKIIRRKDGGSDASVARMVVKVAKGGVWAVASLMVLSNLGYNVSALVAGLGVGGIAVAFALQNILGDIFSSVSIYFDKPFEVGDFIVVGEHMGVVKRIGIKSTRIEALQGEEVVISNRELTSARIQNFKKMQKRRVIFRFTLAHGADNRRLRHVLDVVKDVVGRVKLAELERVHFKEFSPVGLVFEVSYFIKSAGYTDYMDAQQDINFGIKEGFEKESLSFSHAGVVSISGK